MNHEAMLRDLEQHIAADIPGYANIVKEHSRLMQFFAALVWVFNRHFISDYVTTIGTTVYVPHTVRNRPDMEWRALAHEWLHLQSFRSRGPILFALAYLFPASLSVLSILSLI